ncbi:MAG: cation transporting ATPase C-terminal domain-containing protein, partial [Saprospiraceae bacterium]|nr:cation transporting ATPase C-terminal domain-containing protein [Saprospiraceae bacterium]
QTAWFVESLLTELVILLIVRTRRPFFRSRPGRWLWISTVAVAAAAIVLPYLPGAAEMFGFTPLPAMLMLVLVGITLAYAVANELLKGYFFRRFGG